MKDHNAKGGKVFGIKNLERRFKALENEIDKSCEVFPTVAALKKGLFGERGGGKI